MILNALERLAEIRRRVAGETGLEVTLVWDQGEPGKDPARLTVSAPGLKPIELVPLGDGTDDQIVSAVVSAVRSAADGPFRAAWARLAEAGWCDSSGGAEFERVHAAWCEAGRPADIDVFIRRHANELGGPRS